MVVVVLVDEGGTDDCVALHVSSTFSLCVNSIFFFHFCSLVSFVVLPLLERQKKKRKENATRRCPGALQPMYSHAGAGCVPFDTFLEALSCEAFSFLHDFTTPLCILPLSLYGCHN